MRYALEQQQNCNTSPGCWLPSMLLKTENRATLLRQSVVIITLYIIKDSMLKAV